MDNGREAGDRGGRKRYKGRRKVTGGGKRGKDGEISPHDHPKSAPMFANKTGAYRIHSCKP